MHLSTVSIILAAATTVSSQSVVGAAYGFAAGVTGGGDAPAETPSSVEELAAWLSDDTPRTIVIDREYDFTGQTATDSGCDRNSCSAANGGQLYLGTLSCGSSDNVPVSSITYDVAGTEPLAVGSNKSILGAGGKAVLNGKGLSVSAGSSNVIIQGIEITNLNPGIVWGGDGLDLKGSNDGVWIDHCKFSKIGRQFIVSHYDGSRFTISNNEFDGVTKTSATCNGDHYWTMMLIGEGDRATLDRNYFHDVSGRAPKLGETGTFHATNNYFKNMDGHAFEAYEGTVALLEGNAFESVNTPFSGSAIATIFDTPDAAASGACESVLGRSCAVNAVDADSGSLTPMSSRSALQPFSSLTDVLVVPVAASEVASLVSSNAGPANLGSSAATPDPAPEAAEPPADDEPAEEEAEAEEPAAPSAEEVPQWQQCGGNNWTGSTKCAAGLSCVAHNEWYSQCLSSAARLKARSILRI
ncbi:pectin lyase fold/virulence factor [Emericellopsis atlantica]|uniref:pectin lyase n=1 Tax=Emericellopsis atlantica TaxID=2614577 RepID=A0A9P7ZKV2_9HYPO|nr:pectin lyase fold/virulence factor [Emericellopsis atlantica]KAG9253988.1 pectin lyase fold/virulence factor [Emericellopsis atlantica]